MKYQDIPVTTLSRTVTIGVADRAGALVYARPESVGTLGGTNGSAS